MAATDYAADTYRLGYRGGKDTPRGPIEKCVTCGATSFLPIRVEDSESFWVCFACGYTCGSQEVDHCDSCGVLTSNTIDDFPVCERCAPDYEMD